ncbi:CoA synthetase short-chain family member 3, mitochondrial [Seminavis robusta]|uniref:CoA synthetase short-chain family member 3, mitochondrial n=1 Tax=Seminavis robusta TaxID=568900 RepID=A0A9N8DJM2_9STRA|nr:CoA synthetase short-chain family member 3, mitochondrial [Seminavis robusta]|eukprot:Sro120_g058350.1 CoA synthetase short-chain family member 3, mitochondrial (681) ;mRNA; r:24094-26458
MMNVSTKILRRAVARSTFSRPWSSISKATSLVDRSQVEGPHGKYQEEYDLSRRDPEAFWGNAAKSIEWFREPSVILEQDSQDINNYRWFPDGIVNTCYNCLDVHVKNGRGNQLALVYDSPITGNTKISFTYSELLEQVATFAGVLRDELGVEQGDRVVIYMPMIPEAVIAMLACARIGAVHSVVFGGFAAKELATRITDCDPKVIISASAGVEPKRIVPYKPLLDKALELAQHNVQHTVIVQRPNVKADCPMGPKDREYQTLMGAAQPADAVPLPANHMHYILTTSGTTGKPKGVVRDTAGWAVALKWSMGAFYDTNPGEVFWAASDIGWVVGHAYIVYAPLLNGCTTILYEGKPVGTPDAGAFWRVIEEYGAKTLFTAPTAFRAMKQADPNAEMAQQYDLSSLKNLFLAGEHSDPDTLHWCERALDKYNVPAVDHWWQTELGWPGVGNSVGLGRMPIKYGACSAPVPGFELAIADDQGNILPHNTLGDMILKLPLPPGSLTTLYGDHDRFIKSYLTKYPGYYDSGDAVYVDDDGYIHIMGRNDDVINTAGHRLSTGSMEEILMDHSEVADCAVVAAKDELKGQIPVGFVIVNAGSEMDHETLKQELVQRVRNELGPVAAFKKVAVVKALPKTRSGKTLRGTMSKIADGEEYKVTPTIEDPTVLEYLEPIIQELMGRKSN